MADELYRMTAREAVRRLRAGEVSPLELVEASIARIEAVDDGVNALPYRLFEQAREAAKAFDVKAAAENPKSLCGLPIAVKDTNDVVGAPTTIGSPILKDNMPSKDDATVRRLRANGAIPMAKSNLPEWSAGGNTFNDVYGITRNPWDTRLCAGGSSGGSSVALATGQVWLATGSDLGGSLRTPASFNGIVGLRPGPGRVPRTMRYPAMDTLWVEGPLARNVGDLALMLDAGAGADGDDPLSFDTAERFVDALGGGPEKLRVAFSPDLGIVPMEPEVADVCRKAVERLSGLGIDVTDDIPDFSGALDSFRVLRAMLFGTMMSPIVAAHRDQLGDHVITNTEAGLKLTPEEVFTAERQRMDVYARVQSFFETHDLLICPTVSVPPFPVEQLYVEMIAGKPCETYVDWLAITFALTLPGCPVMSLPCGFTSDGMPAGIQIMAPPRGEAKLIAAAERFEAAFGMAERLPIAPKVTH